MIDFRYHLVSLIAVFMALATGILVGSSLLNQSLIDSQRSTIASQAAEKDNLRSDLDATRDQLRFRDSYLDDLADPLLTSRLQGSRVLLITTPTAAGRDVDALRETVEHGGASVLGRIRLEAKYFSDLDDPPPFAAEAERHRQILRSNPIPRTRSADADAQLAGALLTRGSDRTLGAAAQALLTALDRDGFIDRSTVRERADLVVVLVGPPPPEQQPSVVDRVARGLPKLTLALDAASRGVVVVGPRESALDGALRAVRSDSDVRDRVSTVDSVDSVFGQFTTVFALAEQRRGLAGHYGAADGAKAAFPDPADEGDS